MDKEVLQKLSWCLRGSQRKAIIQILDKPKTPGIISEETKIKFSNVSDNLRLMEKEGIVKCLNPKDQRGRLYSLTKVGDKVRKELLN